MGQVNFLSDKSTTPHMAMADLRAHFGIAPSTGGNKAKLVRTALGMRQFDRKWTLANRLSDSCLPWLITVDVLVVDAPAACRHPAGGGCKRPHSLCQYLVRRGCCGFPLTPR